MAGIHQLWSFDPVSSRISVRAGTTNEGLVDGKLASAWFAQTSGLAVSLDGATLWLVDAETSSLRRVHNGVVHTEVGEGLFDFGLVDGDAAQAMLQHPLGLAVLADDSVVIADTYNGALRRFDPGTRQLTTLAKGLAEPSGVVAAGEHVLITETNAHRVSALRVPDAILETDAHRMQRPRAPLSVRPGKFDLTVAFAAPAGQKLDDRFGPATHLMVSASPEGLLADGAGSGVDLNRTLEFATGVPSGVLHVSVRAASCDTDDAQYPACHVHQQDWGIQVEVSDTGTDELTLPLLQQ